MPRESRVCENKRQRSLNNYEDTRRDICHKRHPILMGWHRHGDESEYVKTSVSAV